MQITKMQIETGDLAPVWQRPYPIIMKHYGRVRSEINRLLDAQVIHSSHSSWLAPIIVVPKGDCRKCLVIDYRALNKVTWKFVWPMPRVEDIFSKLNSTKYISTLNLYAGYHHKTPQWRSLFPKQLSHHLGNVNIFNFPFGTGRSTSVPPKNWWIKY